MDALTNILSCIASSQKPWLICEDNFTLVDGGIFKQYHNKAVIFLMSSLYPLRIQIFLIGSYDSKYQMGDCVRVFEGVCFPQWK